MRPKKYKCSMCNNKFSTLKGAIIHNEEKHSGYAKFDSIFYDISKQRQLPLMVDVVPTGPEDHLISSLSVQLGITYHEAKAKFFGRQATL